MEISLQDFQRACSDIQEMRHYRSLNATACILLIEELQTMDNRLIDFFCAVRLLSIVSRLQIERSDRRLVTDVLLTVLQQQCRRTDRIEPDNIVTWNTVVLQLFREGDSTATVSLVLEVAITYVKLKEEGNHNNSGVCSCVPLYLQLAASRYLCDRYEKAIQYCKKAIPYERCRIYVERLLLPHFDSRVSS